jgi:hypothetical protein
MTISADFLLSTFQRDDLTSAEKLVYVTLELHQGTGRLTNRELATKCSLNEFSVSNILKSLRLRALLPAQRACAAVAGR